MDINEFSIEFLDPTLNEAEGYFKEVKTIMDSETWKDQEWMLESLVYIHSITGTSEMLLHLYHNMDIYIMEYKSILGDVFYNPDIQIISEWASSHGWNMPEPHTDLVLGDIEFWKHFWEVFLINSKYLDQKFGKREEKYEDLNEKNIEDSDN
jgi:hypothetical protein